MDSQVRLRFTGTIEVISHCIDPPDYEIKDLMQLHGGKYCHYYSREVVTHMITVNLPHSKIKKLTNEKVVTPDWIVERYIYTLTMIFKCLRFAPERKSIFRLTLKCDWSIYK